MAKQGKTLFIPGKAFYNNKKLPERRKKLPPFIGMQRLREPVCFYQKIGIFSYVSSPDVIRKIVSKLDINGYPCAAMWGVHSTDGAQYINKFDIENPNTYIVHETVDGYIELITPFYEPDTARENIDKVLRLISDIPYVSIEGAITPTYFYQIEPRTPYTNEMAKKVQMFDIIMQKNTGISISELKEKYSDTNKFVFRGHNFMYSDKKAPYATPTKRAGRTGKAYATNNIDYAMAYSGHSYYLSSNSFTPNYLTRTLLNGEKQDIDIGFITVYKASPRNMKFFDFGIELLNNNDPNLSIKSKLADLDTKDPETLVSPVTNPVVATYFLTGDTAIPVDLNDPDWRAFVDCFAPDITEMYNDTKQWQKYKENHHKKSFDRETLENLTYESYGTYDYGSLYYRRLLNQRDIMHAPRNQQIIMKKAMER